MPELPIYPETIEPSSNVGDVLTTMPDGTVDWEVPTSGGGSSTDYREVVMESGIIPPEPLLNSAGDDWLYGVPE